MREKCCVVPCVHVQSPHRMRWRKSNSSAKSDDIKKSVSTAHQWSNNIISFSQSCSSSHSLRRIKFVLAKCVQEERGKKNKVEKMRVIEIGTPTFVSFYPTTNKKHTKYFHRLEARIFFFLFWESNEIVLSSDGKYFEYLRVTQAHEMQQFYSKNLQNVIQMVWNWMV